MPADKTFYELLSVSMNASMADIRKAYHKRANECHPDRVRNLDPEIQALAEAKMTKLNEAYHVLTDEARRAEYDQWLMANKDIKISADGTIQREEEEEVVQEQGLSTEELIEKLEKAINYIKNQILAIDPTIRWKELQQEGFDVVIEGMRRIERFYIYINTVDILRGADIENLIANSEEIVAGKRFLLHKKFSLFLVLYLEDEDDDKIRADIRNFNHKSLQKTGTRRTDTTMVAILNIKTNELYFPYVKGFQPNLEALSLPENF